MSSASQSPFRFVPTLTEIVRPNDFAATEMLEQQQLTDRLLQRIMPKVEAQLRATLQTLVQEQMRMLEPFAAGCRDGRPPSHRHGGFGRVGCFCRRACCYRSR